MTTVEKPEYKVKVTTPKPFVTAGEKTKYTVEAKYFFGAPVKNADVKYYIYRSSYYPWWWQEEDDGLGDLFGCEHSIVDGHVAEFAFQCGVAARLATEVTFAGGYGRGSWDTAIESRFWPTI